MDVMEPTHFPETSGMEGNVEMETLITDPASSTF